jgi:hypothetical protein
VISLSKTIIKCKQINARTIISEMTPLFLILALLARSIIEVNPYQAHGFQGSPHTSKRVLIKF